MASPPSSPSVVRIERAGVPLCLDGAGARVAVVDSGVEGSHPWFERCDLTHARVVKQGKRHHVIPDEGGDRSGHGTACAGIIHQMVPAAAITSIRALSDDGRCSRSALLAAIQHCIRERFDVVNLSLGIDMPRQAGLRPSDYQPILSLYELADIAATVGVLLVASGPNVAQFRTYPGRFKSLIGVGRGRFDDPDALRTLRTADHELIAPGTDVVAPAIGGGERRWTGTSFATPFVSAHVARVRAATPGAAVEHVKNALHRLAAAHSAAAEASPTSARAAAARNPQESTS